MLVWICRFPLPLGVLKGLRFVIMALAGLFSNFFFHIKVEENWSIGFRGKVVQGDGRTTDDDGWTDGQTTMDDGRKLITIAQSEPLAQVG